MDIRTAISEYYFTHIDELPPEKRFHFGSRLLAWTGDSRAKKLLQRSREYIVPQGALTDNALTDLFRSLATHQPDVHIPSFKLREPYFHAFPRLFGVHQALFRLRHLYFVYGIDGRAAFDRAIPRDTLYTLEHQLLADPAAMRMLATYAINYLYLFRRMILGDEHGIKLESLYSIGDEYDPTDPEALRLLIYLYTHCIVAESNFYVRTLPAHSLAMYHRMLARIEKTLAAQFSQASLDTKLEYLVCCRIANFQTDLTTRIEQECADSISPDGTFIIDAHNSFAELQHKKTFATSEHRNVLFIMSGSAFTPHSTLVDD